MNSALISVMIPTYNRAKYIAQAIDSVIAQDYRPIEIIVVDDGSTDNTADTVKQYDSNIVKYYYKENSGVSDTRNYCVKKSSGEYLAWLDSDDYYLPGKLSAQAQYLNTHPECEIVFTEVEDFFDNEKTKKSMNHNVYNKILFGGSKAYHATMLARKEIVKRIGELNINIKVYEDKEWLARALFVHNVDLSHCLNGVYLRRRLHGHGITYKHGQDEKEKAVSIINNYMRESLKKKLKTTKT